MNQELTSISTNLQDEVVKLQVQFIDQFHTWFSTQLTNNEFLVAGVFTVLTSAAIYLLRNVPLYIWNFLTYRLTVTVTIFNNNPNFYDIARELNKNTIQLFSRSKMLDQSKLTIGLGHSVSYFLGRICRVDRSTEKSDSREFKQTMTMTFPFLTHRKLVKLFDKFIEEKSKEKSNKIRVYQASNNYLQFMKETPKRMRESIFLPTETLEYVEDRIKFFLANREWYVKRGIPYKYAILLHGVPGTGKTTLAKYIASFTNRSLVIVAPSKLSQIVSSISDRVLESNEYDEYSDYGVRNEDGKPEKFIGLMEDIDCDNVTTKRRTRKDFKKAINTDEDDDTFDSSGKSKQFSFTSLSDLLNSIDGLNAPEDFILVATTNHISELDPALLRKGRFDDVIEIKPLETPEIVRMITVFREDVGNKLVGKTFNPIPGSVLQDLILQHMDNPLEKLIEELDKRKP